MKNLFIIFVFVFFSSCSPSVWKVRDLPACSIMVDHHISRHKDYEKIKNNELQKTGLQSALLSQQKKLSTITNKLKKRYNSVQPLIYSVGRIPHILSIIKDCKNYQMKIAEKVINEPKLAIIAVKTEIEVLKRINRLYKWIYANAVITTEFNIMKNEERIQCINYVANELKALRGLLYGVDYRLKFASEGMFLNEVLMAYDINSYLLDFKEKEKIVKKLKIW
ncbi:hypothetical protein [Tenacibaculum finnmarkense]|uniref:hypothetical protein n=1 Tax=Tenacibaculum finnmarkense TaxID=2781243 RepID=UPI001EFAEDD8|nr:hypothetical protein [Tenacibaculum finnmarkense]MCG8226382.1 hypothetical protein [Tenacibaculum finnmarkense genomovar finnmarkense]